MSKGSGRRKKQITDKQFKDNWDAIFSNKDEPEPTITTIDQVEELRKQLGEEDEKD